MPWTKDNLPDAVKGKDWTDAQIEQFVKSANAILEETGDEGKAISIAISQVEEKKNAKQMPQVFYAKHLEAGHATYENETILLDNPILMKMAPSFIGKPVFAGNHQKVDMENLQTQADGYIVESFFNVDGWLWVKFIAVSDAAFDAINRGWGVSNAYIPTEFSGSGTHHNTPYDRKILDGYFTHLAIVEYPRYEESRILTPEEFKAYQEQAKAKVEELKNSKPTKTEGLGKMFKIFKTKKEEISQVSPDSLIELENGKSVSIQEMLNAVKKDEEEEKKKDEESEKVNMDMEIEVDGESMTIKDLVNKYKNAMKKNSEDKDEDDKSKENTDDADEDDKSKENEDEEEKKKEEDEKSNSKFFSELMNAHRSTGSPVIELSQDQVARGKSRYGSAK